MEIQKQIQDLIDAHKTELKNEIINKYFNHTIIDLNKFNKIALSNVNYLGSKWSGGHSVSNLLEQAQREVWLELATNSEMYI
jgi:hypothetical protein